MAESVFAIEVLTTKRGKLRKLKAWACLWRQPSEENEAAGWHIRTRWPVYCKYIEWYFVNCAAALQQAEHYLGCRCRVVEILLTEKVV